MDSITAMTGVTVRNEPSVQVMRPLQVDAPVALDDPIVAVRWLDPVSEVRRAEAAFARDDATLVNELRQIDTANLSVASLYQLQVRTILFKVKHEAVAGVVMNLNQSMKTILNAA
ncbi:hypothetical protein [Burkholderia sp. 572]|uniref:hypothetical protein n=1 Tax=Burkholderia sp. 572 TaxID=3156414 RepID=UPI003399A897